MFETIVALATPPAKSALAIIRISGENCFQITQKIFSNKINTSISKSVNYGYIKDDEEIIDQVILLSYISPHSFTGENSVEIITHGSMLIVNQIISLLIKNGARLAVNGEFSSRAYLNGKIDLIQAEAINDMINATSKEAKDLSILSLNGETSKIFKPIRNQIGEILSKLEVNIDYPEYEDIEITSKSEVIKVCSNIVEKLNELIINGEKDRKYREGVKVAIVGKPNVGKSSLLNAFLNEDKAIVTDIAGTTRDIVEGEYNLEGVPIHFFDTAGLHESNDKIEKIGISKAKKAIEEADLILFVIDNTGIDEKLFELIKNKKYILIKNKTDISPNRDSKFISVSAKNKDIKQLITKIKEMLQIGDVVIKPSFNNTRQLGILKNIVESLKIAIQDAKNDEPTDLVSASIMQAYNFALDLTGESNKNDLTDEIFSRFCVGK